MAFAPTFILDKRPIPKPTIRQKSFGCGPRWICLARCAPWEYPAFRIGFGDTEREAYANWLDENGLYHEDFC
jgi:hypothetical protein